MRFLFALSLGLLACGGTTYCQVDSECQVYSDFCTCTCAGLRKGEGVQRCTTLVCADQADLCAGRTAACVDSMCTAR
jgi:hypothetical protein